MTSDEIKEFRERYNYTQEQLAERLGVVTNTVARWERDETKIPGFLKLALDSVERENILAQITKFDRPDENLTGVQLLTEEQLIKKAIEDQTEEKKLRNEINGYS